MTKRSLPIATIIHLFAAAHATVALLSRSLNYIDDVPLTVLTILMIVIISLRRGLQMELVAVLSLIGCFMGYLLGTYGAMGISFIIHNDLIAPAITTFLITEMVGWATFVLSKYRSSHTNNELRWSPSTFQIILIAAAILLLRISYTLIFRSAYFAQAGIYPEFQRLFANTFALTALLCGNIIFVSLLPRLERHRELRTAITIAFTALFSLLITLLVYYELPQGNNTYMNGILLFRLYSVILLADIVVYTIMSLVNYVLRSNVELRNERGKKHQAQYQYNKLKQQINPHFLFNSLNILDYLVQEQQTERASAFIRKLANTYRYMLNNEDEQLVMLSEELDFATMYIALLQERFSNGFTVQTTIPQAMMRRHVIPCCLQLLIENATKHNIVSAEEPLIIQISIEEGLLTVRNNLQPRISSQQSTHMGLKNIRQQYLDISGQPIVVEKTKTEFCVKLPLL
ncbi:MAG: histidine kinase [Alistipes sp.]